MTTTAGLDEQRAIDQLTSRLASRHPELPSAIVVEAITDATCRFSHARVRDFVPLLVERRAEHRLSATQG